MKKNLSVILAGVSCLLAALCLFQLSKLNKRLNNMESNIASQIGWIREDVSSVSGNITASLENQASLLADGQWDYGAANIPAHSVELNCTVSPRVYYAETEAFIIVNGNEYPMVLSGDSFKACIEVPLFMDTSVEKVVFHEGDVTRTEQLDWYISPRYAYLPNVYADFSGNITGTPKDGVFHQKYDGFVNINADSWRPNTITKIDLVEILDGKESKRTNIQLDSSQSMEQFYYAYEMKNDFEIPYGSTWKLCLEVVDDNGLIYSYIIDWQEIDDNGEPSDDNHYWYGIGASIYDKEGNLLYSPDMVEAYG